jgi:quercetin 2,3-dioxygenase
VTVDAGDVAVLRAGTGLAHDEVAGDAGARVLQCYLRAAEPAAAPRHEVHRAVSGWVDLGRSDARLWTARIAPGAPVEVPPGLLVARGTDGVLVEHQTGRTVTEPGLVLVWQLDAARPAWAG